MKRTEIKTALLSQEFDNEINVKGWVRNKRGSKNVAFIALNDGSTINNLQLVIDLDKIPEERLALMHTGASVSATGKLVASSGSGQNVELAVSEIELLGPADPDKYPLQPKKHSLEFLRDIAHLRFRTNTFGAIMRLRHAMVFAIHKFFNDRGFYNIHTPLITASDCEGAGEMFQVTTLDLNNLPRNEKNEIDYTQDFFGKPARVPSCALPNAVAPFMPAFIAASRRKLGREALWELTSPVRFGIIINILNEKGRLASIACVYRSWEHPLLTEGCKLPSPLRAPRADQNWETRRRRRCVRKYIRFAPQSAWKVF